MAGVYNNEITVLSAGRGIKTIPLKFTVWNFELPSVHILKTFFPWKIRDISKYHNVRKDSLKDTEIRQRYLMMLQDHGINMPFPISPKINRKTGEVILTLEYVRQLKTYAERMHPSVTKIKMRFEKDAVKQARYLSSWEAFLKGNLWVPQPIIYFNEPSTIEDYLRVIKYGKAINTYAPSIKFLVTEQIKPQKPNFPSLEGAVDIWVPSRYWARPEDIKRRQTAGDEVWSGGALGRKGVATLLIDFPLLDYLVPAWANWNLDVKGFLYWQTTSWSKKDVRFDPWVNSETYSLKGKIWNGCGSLVYPGHDAGIDGPIASMRLKVFRDSIEDYDYFSILSELTGRHEVEEIVGKITKDFKTYSKNINEYLEGRTLVAQKIIEKRK